MATLDTQNEVVDSLMTFVTSTWVAAANGAPLYYDNQDAERPDVPSIFGRTVVRHTFGERASLGSAGSGSKVNRRYGDLYIQMFVPQGDGQEKLRALADSMAFALEDASFTIGVRLGDTQINELGTDGVYWQINVVTGFNYDRVS